MYILAAAARMRTALVTCTSWRSRLQAHRELLVSHGTADLWSSPVLAPSFWKSAPFACFLEDAANGFPYDKRLARGGLIARE
eukprot:1532715-Pyramimonas_sp.AAC.1